MGHPMEGRSHRATTERSEPPVPGMDTGRQALLLCQATEVARQLLALRRGERRADRVAVLAGDAPDLVKCGASPVGELQGVAAPVAGSSFRSTGPFSSSSSTSATRRL